MGKEKLPEGAHPMKAVGEEVDEEELIIDPAEERAFQEELEAIDNACRPWPDVNDNPLAS